MAKKYIFIKAYFQNNLGDDMFVHYLAMRYPNVNFLAYANKEKTLTFQHLKNIRFSSSVFVFLDRIANKLLKKRIWNHLFEKKAIGTVFIGGSVFIEPPDFRKPSSYFCPQNMYYIGCNFGPYRTQAYLDFIRYRIEKASDICFRDTLSYNVFSDLPNVRVAPDVLFGYPCFSEKRNGEGIGISVIALEHREGLSEKAELYYKAIAKVIDFCYEMNIPVKLFSFCKVEGDEAAIHQIREKATHKDFATICYNGNVNEILDEINSCEYMIATRFHAMIIGWCMHKKVFPIVYSQKQLSVMNDVDYKGMYWNLKDESYESDNLLTDCLKAERYGDLSETITKANAQFSGFDKFVEKMEGLK